jgi:alpha-mannosidase
MSKRENEMPAWIRKGLRCGVLGFACLFGFIILADEGTSQPTLHMVAVAHLDTQWRWTVRDTIDPFLRNTLEDNFYLFEKYPDYLFNFEGSFRYALMKDYYPEQYEQMKEYIRNGRWHISGAFLDAMDVVIPTPEALIRSALYADRFYKSEFGFSSLDLFLPDSFGFPITLPAIAKHFGATGFSTQKLGWGSSVGIPFNIGMWEGLDGSLLPAVLHAGPYDWKLRRNLSQDNGLLQLARNQYQETGFNLVYRYFGVGDQGGAPEESTVAWISKAVNESEGPLAVEFAGSSDLFTAMTPEDVERLPRYKGELLMTRHGVGSYTSYGPVKWWNRQNERMALAAERAAVVALHEVGNPYPAESFNQAWHRFLWHQQHDGVTGTSIPDANDIMINDLVISHNQFADILGDSISRWATQLDTEGPGQPIVLFNPSPYPRVDLVEVELPADLEIMEYRILRDGRSEVVQRARAPNATPRIIFEAEVPALALATYHLVPAGVDLAFERASVMLPITLDSDELSVRINKAGQIESIRCAQTNREWLDAPIAWQLLLNTPPRWPAWEIEYSEIMALPVAELDQPQKIELIESGPHRSTIRMHYRHGDSTLQQDISLTRRAGQPIIQVNVQLDWHTYARLLKVAFPARLSDPIALYDTGLGYVERGVNQENLYEVPAHDWAAIGEQNGEAGLVIISDAKVGWDRPASNILRHTIIHSPNDIMTDFGRHHIQFAIMPRSGDWRSGLHQISEQITHPLLAFAAQPHSGMAAETASFLELLHPNVKLMALKKAEDSDLLIIRLGEVMGKELPEGRISFPGRRISEAYELDGLEQPVGVGAFQSDQLVFSMAPYQLRTFGLRFEGDSPTPSTVRSYPVLLRRDVQLAAAPETTARTPRLDTREFPESIEIGRTKFDLKPQENDDGKAMRCQGQLLKWAAVDVDRIDLLVASERGNRWSTWIAGNQEYVRHIPDLFEEIGLADRWERRGSGVKRTFRPGHLKHDRLAWHATRLIAEDGSVEPYTYAYLHMISIPVEREQLALQVPNDPHLLIFAATAVSDPDVHYKPLNLWGRSSSVSDAARFGGRGWAIIIFSVVLVFALAGTALWYWRRISV